MVRRMVAGVDESPYIVRDDLVQVVVVGAEGKQSGRDVKCQCLSGRRLDLSEEGRGDEDLNVRLKDVGNQLVRELLRALARLYGGRGFT